MPAAIVVVRAVVMIAIMIVLVSVNVSRPGRKWIGETPPGVRAAGHFLIGEQATIERILERASINAARHHRERLPAISKRFLPFFSSTLRHLRISNVRIACRPPMARGCALDLRSRQIEAANFIHPGSEPEETFGAKQAW